MAGSDHDDLDDLTACQTTNRLEDALYSLETVASRGACQDSWLVPAMEELTARGFHFEAVNLFAQSCGNIAGCSRGRWSFRIQVDKQPRSRNPRDLRPDNDFKYMDRSRLVQRHGVPAHRWSSTALVHGEVAETGSISVVAGLGEQRQQQ